MAHVIVVMRSCVGVVCEVQGDLQRRCAARSVKLDDVHMRGHPLVEYDIACRLARLVAFAVASFGYRALMFVCLALACGVSGDAVKSVAWLTGNLFALSTGVEVNGASYDLGDGLIHEVFEDLIELRRLLEAISEGLFDIA